MHVKITTMSENTAPQKGILAEWGLSILIETDAATVLFDAGQGISAARNAASLGVDLSKVDFIVLSHGHYDHTGGLREVLKVIRKEVDVIAHPEIWGARYSKRKKEVSFRYIGVPFCREELESLGARFQLKGGSFALLKTSLLPVKLKWLPDLKKFIGGFL